MGTVLSSDVHGNTATSTTPGAEGADFYNTGAATFEVEPDAAGGHIATINDSLYSTGTAAAITIDPAGHDA